MKTKALTLSLICAYGISFGQSEVAIIDKNVNPGQVIDELPPPPPALEGSVYLFDDWMTGKVKLKTDAVIKDYPLKYDLRNNVLELRVEGQVKVCALHMFTEFELNNSIKDFSKRYVNTAKLTPSSEIPLGIAELLHDDVVMLINYHNIEIKDPTYVPAVDMGNRNKKVITSEKMFVIYNGKTYELNSNVKKNDALFKKHQEQMEEYVKSNKLKLKKPEDAIKAIAYFNTLL